MKRPAKKHTFKPTMEALESRWCPATSITTPQAGTVVITGGDDPNTVQIFQNDTIDRLVIITDNVSGVFASSKVTDVVINLNGGNDRLTYQLGGGPLGGSSDFFRAKSIKVDLGAGDDVATFNFADNGAGGLANVRVLNLDIQAGIGKDQVDAFFGSVNGDDGRGYGQGVTLTGNMGYGDDRFNAELKDKAIDYGPVVDSSGITHPPRPGSPTSMHIDRRT